MPRRLSGPPVFVYGSLRPGAHGNRAAARLLREANHLGPATFQGRLYRIHWYPGAIPSTDPTDLVYGDLFKLPPRGDLLAALDAFERFDPRRPKRGDFRRALYPVAGPHGQVDAWIYTYFGPVSEDRRIGSGDFP